MNIKLIVIFSFSLLYASFEFLIGRRPGGDRKITQTGDKGSIWILISSITLGYWLSFITASSKTGRIYHWNTLFIAGCLIVIIGLIIRVSAILKLKQLFTYTVTNLENHELIESGLYKVIRHPAYLGQLIVFMGTSVCLSNWLSILLMMIPVVSGYLYRINIEEQFMSSQMGQKYSDYKKRTKKLIPYVY
jgi:protein-S-isoprenylcysteine O-methyltransferase Ste14